MTTLLFIACIVLLAGLACTLLFAGKNHHDGYEDELGFHYGAESNRRPKKAGGLTCSAD